MARIRITPEFLGSLGELYFKTFCQQRNYGYTNLERIHETLPTPIVHFTFGFKRIPILLPKEILGEVTKISTPNPVNGTDSYVFDFLTSKVSEQDSTEYPNSRRPEDFCWIEIKTGASQLSQRQRSTADNCKIRFALFRVRNPYSGPRGIEIDWEFDSSWRSRAA